MYSVYARNKLLARGWSLSSFFLFFSDSWRESVANVRERDSAALSIITFAAMFLVVLTAAAAILYLPDLRREFARLALYAFTATAGFTAWALLNIGLLRRPDGTDAPGVGVPNYLTLVRFYLIVPVIVLFVHGHYVVSFALYLLLGLTDVADGVVARRWGDRTEFGVVMDPLADVVSNAAVFATFLYVGLIPGWLFAILMVRYALLIVGSFVLFLVTGPIQFRSTVPGKVVGVLQAAGIAVIVICVIAGFDWQEDIGPVLFPFLGLCFASIVVSQLVIGLRHKRRLARIRKKAVEVGS